MKWIVIGCFCVLCQFLQAGGLRQDTFSLTVEQDLALYLLKNNMYQDRLEEVEEFLEERLKSLSPEQKAFFMEESSQSQAESHRYLWVSILGVLVLVLVGLGYRFKRKRIIDDEFADKSKTIDMMTTREETDIAYMDIYKKFHSANDTGVIIGEEDWLELQKCIDQTYDNFTGHLYQRIPAISLMELRICYLIKISVKVTDMAVILHRSKSSISSARTRLYMKLTGKEGSPGQLDELLADI